MNRETITLDRALDAAMQLPPEQREILLAILRNREIEGRRQEIADNARESIAMFQSRKLRRQSKEEIIQELHRASQEPE